MAAIENLKLKCIEVASGKSSYAVEHFKKFDYALDMFAGENQLMEKATGLLFYLIHLLESAEDPISIIQDNFDEPEVSVGQVMSTQVALRKNVGLISRLGFAGLQAELPEINREAVAQLKKAGVGRATALALIATVTGFQRRTDRQLKADLYNHAGLSYQAMNVFESTSYERLKLKLLQSSVWIGSDGTFSSDPKCQGTGCESQNGTRHTATVVIYCSACSSAELICEKIVDKMRYNTIAPTVYFSNTCNHMDLDYRNCHMASIPLNFLD